MKRSKPEPHSRAPAPYTKYKKRPHTYPNTPLHKPAEGLTPTAENVRKFRARLGIN
jgi:hypothetical protein